MSPHNIQSHTHAAIHTKHDIRYLNKKRMDEEEE